MGQTEQDIARALGVMVKPVAKLDLSQCLKDRYHHRLSYQAIADKYGTSWQAVQHRIKDFEAKLGDPDDLQSFRDVEADIQTAIKTRISSQLLVADLSKSTPKDLALTYGIIYDKNRLQTGQSTSNQSVFFQCVSESDTQDVVLDADVIPPPEA